MLLNKNIDLKDKPVIRLEKSVKADGVNGIMQFGEKNDYSETIELIVNNSKTAKSVSRVYANFLEGNGFVNEAINDIVIAKDSRQQKVTVRDLLNMVCKSIALHNGFYFRISRNLEGKIKDVSFLPFKYCRFSKPDDSGYSAKIGIHSNWSDDYDAIERFKKEKINWFNVFSSDENVIVEQINKAGGFEKYKGQIFFRFFDNNYLYPISPFDQVYLDCDTEYQISLYMNAQTRNGFTNKIVMRVVNPRSDEEASKLKNVIKNLTSVDGDQIVMITDDIDPQTGEIQQNGAFKIENIKTNIDATLFDTWHATLANNIRKVFNVPAILVDYEQSKLGTTSGEAIIQATNFMNSITKSDRYQIERTFKEVFSTFDNEILANNTDWTIKELNLYVIPAGENVDQKGVTEETQTQIKPNI